MSANGSVTVVLPEISEEKLSSRERSSGKKARRGWIRVVTGTDPTAKGGYALLADEPFARPGEALIAVGAVVAIVDFEGDVRLAKVAPSGRLIRARGGAASPGKFRIWSLSRETVSLCEEVERLRALPAADHLREVVALIEALPGDCRTESQTSDLEHAKGLLAAMTIAADKPSREELIAERESLLARLAEVEEALAR